MENGKFEIGNWGRERKEITPKRRERERRNRPFVAQGERVGTRRETEEGRSFPASGQAKDPPLLAGGGCGGLRGGVVAMLPGKELVVGRTLSGLVLLMAFTASGLRLASFAGAGAHGAWTFVPPAYGFGRGVEGSGILARALFAMGFGPFVFVRSAHTLRGGARMVVPRPGLGARDGAQRSEQ